MSNVAFIGLGNMGSGMCANLVKAGHSVKAFDLNPQAIEQAIDSGASGARLLQIVWLKPNTSSPCCPQANTYTVSTLT